VTNGLYAMIVRLEIRVDMRMFLLPFIIPRAQVSGLLRFVIAVATVLSAVASAGAQSAEPTDTSAAAVSTIADTKARAVGTTADTILFNGAIYTEDACRRWANAVAIKDGRFIFVGADAQAKQFAGDATTLVDLHGQMVLPGFHDCHVHPVESGIEKSQCCLDEATTREEVLKGISQYVKKHPDIKWLIGNGWALTVFPGANALKADLDSVVADKPALLYSQDAHSVWINSKAMALAGITSATKDPPLGRIERDKNGEPSGTLRESAMDSGIEAGATYFG
jgi:predicted amidohydrolase YtcJ